MVSSSKEEELWDNCRWPSWAIGSSRPRGHLSCGGRYIYLKKGSADQLPDRFLRGYPWDEENFVLSQGVLVVNQVRCPPETSATMLSATMICYLKKSPPPLQPIELYRLHRGRPPERTSIALHIGFAEALTGDDQHFPFSRSLGSYIARRGRNPDLESRVDLWRAASTINTTAVVRTRSEKVCAHPPPHP